MRSTDVLESGLFSWCSYRMASDSGGLRKGARASGSGRSGGAPPAAKVVPAVTQPLHRGSSRSSFRWPTATEHPATSELVVTGTVTPDVSRNVPVVSLASGRVMAIHSATRRHRAEGQLLMTIRSDDVSGGYSTYRMAVADEVLARTQYERAKDLYEHGAIALNDLQVAQDTEDKAKIAVETAAEHLRLLGNDPDKPSFMVDIFRADLGSHHRSAGHRRIAGAGLQHAVPVHDFRSLHDLDRLRRVRERPGQRPARRPRGDPLNAYPDRMFKGRVSNIGAILDPNIRTAKVRIEVQNPGIMRLGMFVTSHLPRSNHGDAHHRPGIRRPAHARSRFRLSFPRRITSFAAWKWSVEISCRTTRICKKSSPDSSQVNKWSRNALVLDHVLGQ